jgi:ferritin-like metal-binding protein YciE
MSSISDRELITLMQKMITEKTKQINELLQVLDFAIDNKSTPSEVIDKIHKTVAKMDAEIQLRELIGGVKQ